MRAACVAKAAALGAELEQSMLQLLGGLLFATCMTRPDCAYAVAFLCQFMQDASPQAYDAGLGILAYMYETRQQFLVYAEELRQSLRIPTLGSAEDAIYPSSAFYDDNEHLTYDGATRRTDTVAHELQKLLTAPGR